MLGFSLLCLDDDERPESGEGAWISILNDTTPVHHQAEGAGVMSGFEAELPSTAPITVTGYQQLYYVQQYSYVRTPTTLVVVVAAFFSCVVLWRGVGLINRPTKCY